MRRALQPEQSGPVRRVDLDPAGHARLARLTHVLRTGAALVPGRADATDEDDVTIGGKAGRVDLQRHFAAAHFEHGDPSGISGRRDIGVASARCFT